MFLDTNVLLEYIGGKAELQHLFSEKVRQRAAFAINGIVLQELLLASRSAPGGIDLTEIVSYLEVVGAGVDLYSPETQAELRELRNRRVMHPNDVLILAGARSCDLLLTYDSDLLTVENAAVRSETPEAFLDELGTAA